MDLAEYRRVSFDIWERMAPEWERRRSYMWDSSRPVGEWMVAALDPAPGQTILELAAGTGETGFAAARELGPEGKLISTDFAPHMVEACRRRAAELGLQNVEFRVMDAERMDMPGGSVDGVLCRWGYMLMADPAAALAETRRVLRQGGRLSFSVWAAPDHNPWATVSGTAMVKHGHVPPPEPGAPGIFGLTDPEHIRALVTAAGFDQSRIEEVPLEWRFDDFEDYWKFVSDLAGAIALAIERLSEEEREPVRDTMREAAAPFASNGGYVMPGLCLNVVAG